MPKPIIPNLPHPSSGAYDKMRVTACMYQIVGGIYMLGGNSFLTKKDDSVGSVLGLAMTTIGVGCFSFGSDIYKSATNLENFHKKNFNTRYEAIGNPIEVKAKFVYEAAMNGLLLKPVYRHLYEPIDERAVVLLLPKKTMTVQK